MKNGKILFIATLLLVSLLCLSAVSAADDAASDVIADNTDETILEESIDDVDLGDSEIDELGENDDIALDSADDEATLGDSSPGTFTDLNNDINGNNNSEITLTRDYKYVDSDSAYKNGIDIGRSVTIEGNGHTLDGSNTARMFQINGWAVIHLKNIKFINGKALDGGAVYSKFIWDVYAENCTFIDNTASRTGGAIFRIYATDSTFINNSAGEDGGAMFAATANNCNFIQNTANEGGAMSYGTANGCTFIFNSASNSPDHYAGDSNNCTFIDSGTLSVSDFITEPHSGEKLLFNFSATVYGEKKNFNVYTTIKITSEDGQEVGNYHALSGEGLALDLNPGKYIATLSIENENVDFATASITVASGTSFTGLNSLINDEYPGNTTIYLTKDYTYDPDFDAEFTNGITIDHSVTIDGNGHTINGAEAARSFRTGDSKYNVTFKNINFKNCFTTGNGGAIYAPASTVINCNFTNNKADMHGGAGCLKTVINCTFTSNTAQIGGGAVEGAEATNCYFYNNHADSSGGAIHNSDATNCTFIGNSANYGGAISYGDAVKCTFTGNSANYGGAISNGHAVDSTFTENHAESRGGAIYHGTAENCNFTNNDANYLGGAIYGGSAVKCIFDTNKGNAYGGAISGDIDTKEPCSAVNCTFTNNCAWAGGALYFGDAINCTFNGNYILRPENSAGNGAAMCGYWDDNDSPCTAINCIFTNNSADEKNAIYKCIADTCVFNGDTYGYDLTILQPVLNAANFISTYNDGSNLVVNITTNSGMPVADAKIKVDVYKTTGEFVGTYNISSGGWKVPLNAGSYIAYYNATDFDIDNAEGMIVVNKAKTTVTSKAVTAVYNNNKYLVITLKDSKGKALSGVYVTVTLSSAKKYKTDKNGQIKVNVGKLVPKTYTAKISFAGNTNYLASSTKAKVVVKKATPKMTAKAKTFKVKVKTKKYTITLKTNKNKVMKKVKVTLKVNKKTFKATTNSKGVATFKITNLKKKGKYTATIKFAGNKYYKALSKKAKITVKK